MKKASALTMVLVFLALAGLGSAGLADTGGTVPINGTANWATRPTGPDFQGVTLIPFEARNPTRAAWEATQAQNQRFLDPDTIPQNIQVSQSGWVEGASHYINDFSEVMVYLDPTDPNHLLGSQPK